MKNKLSLFSLVILTTAALDSIRNLPASALFGSSLIFFFILSAIIFLVPTALVSAELSAIYPEKGGIYNWVNSAFGNKWAMLAIWVQWINTMVWYPTILSFIAGTAAYLINPDLIQNKWFLVIMVPAIFWFITLVNLFGVHISARVNNYCALIGTLLPILCLIVMGFYWTFSGHVSQISLNMSSLIPSFSDRTSWMSLIAIMASFLGMELSGVYVNDIHNPQRNFPRAILIAGVLLLGSMIFGSLAIAVVLPAQNISLVSGVMQVFDNFFTAFGFKGLMPILAILIIVGSTGGITSWLLSPARGLLHAAEGGFLPSFLKHKNRFGVADTILLGQAVLVTLFCSVFLMVPSVNGFYWFLTALSTELYMVMYVLMFLAALCLHYKHKNRQGIFKIPGGKVGIWTTCLLGIVGCLATISVAFLPPGNVNVGSSSRYLVMICLGNLFTIIPVFLFFLYKQRNKV